MSICHIIDCMYLVVSVKLSSFTRFFGKTLKIKQKNVKINVTFLFFSRKMKCDLKFY